MYSIAQVYCLIVGFLSDDVPIVENGALMCPIIIVLWSISPFISANIIIFVYIFWYYDVGCIYFYNCYTSWWIYHFIINYMMFCVLLTVFDLMSALSKYYLPLLSFVYHLHKVTFLSLSSMGILKSKVCLVDITPSKLCSWLS